MGDRLASTRMYSFSGTEWFPFNYNIWSILVYLKFIILDIYFFVKVLNKTKTIKLLKNKKIIFATIFG